MKQHEGRQDIRIYGAIHQDGGMGQRSTRLLQQDLHVGFVRQPVTA
ncbi:hypothetical protein [Bradyrhizobium elkanii]